MTERLLQYIWQLRHFNHNELFTEQGDLLQVISPGNYNSNQGPDFLEGRIRINGDLWAGSIELHLKTSDWRKHAHHKDDRYKNVILHVVWENDLTQGPLFNLPTLELHSRVSGFLLNKYNDMMERPVFIPCENNLGTVASVIWSTWKERMLLERLQRKALYICNLLKQNGYNWEETLWWMMARNFGIKVNADAFEAIARSIPFIVLGRHKNQIHQLEAMLFGQAGLLNETFREQYPAMLQREYHFLRKKYAFSAVNVPVLFLRMRPPGFPSVRLAQLAMFIKSSTHFFSAIRDCIHLKEIKILLKITANDYWNDHYRFEEPAAFKPKLLGNDTVQNIIINTVIPVLYCYGAYHDQAPLIEKSLRWMEELPPENNIISRGWAGAGIAQRHASCSQAFLELKTQYCDKKRCLDCAIGNAVLKGLAG